MGWVLAWLIAFLIALIVFGRDSRSANLDFRPPSGKTTMEAGREETKAAGAQEPGR